MANVLEASLGRIQFAGAGLEAERFIRKVHTVDITSSLSAYVGTKPPSGAVGNIFPELPD